VGFKSSSYLTETLLDPELRHANEANKAAFNKAHNTEEDMWSWLEHPGQGLRLVQFGAAMTSVSLTASNAILKGSVMLRDFENNHLTLPYRNHGRVHLGKYPRRLAGRRYWRRRWYTVIDACYPPTTSSVCCPGPRVCCWECSRGTCIESTGPSKYHMCLTRYG